MYQRIKKNREYFKVQNNFFSKEFEKENKTSQTLVYVYYVF